MRNTILFCLALLGSANASGAADISEANIRSHITYLASDKLKGRAPGTKGERLAQQYIIRQFTAFNLTPKGSKGFLQAFDYKQSHNPHDTLHTSGKSFTGHNVVGFLDNGAVKTIVIGAHYDHLGTDGRGSSLDANPKNKIHNGADDNASGTAGVIELARYYSQNGVKEPVNFLFMCFSAEEAGLIGSKYFTNLPTIDLKSVSCMLNMDMIGRFNYSSSKLLIYGTGTSPVFEPLLKSVNTFGFELMLDSSGVGPSDQTSFYLKNIPVLHFFTGQHSDYHKPSDDADKINYPGEVRVLKYMATLIDSLAQRPELEFNKTRNKQDTRSSFKVTLGIMPDYAYSGEGLRVDGVTEGKPAAVAGIKQGDIIVKLGEVDITDIYKYMEALGKFQKGATTNATFKRGDQTLTLPVTF
jgi:hypothetical protein